MLRRYGKILVCSQGLGCTLANTRGLPRRGPTLLKMSRFLLENGSNPSVFVEPQRAAGYNLGSKNRTKKLTAQPGPPSGRLPPQTVLKSLWAISILIIPTNANNPRKAASASSKP